MLFRSHFIPCELDRPSGKLDMKCAGRSKKYVFGIWGIWLHPGDPSIARGLTTANRLGLAFVESAALLSLALVPGGIVASIRMRRRLAAEKLHIKLNRTKYK